MNGNLFKTKILGLVIILGLSIYYSGILKSNKGKRYNQHTISSKLKVVSNVGRMMPQKNNNNAKVNKKKTKKQQSLDEKLNIAEKLLDKMYTAEKTQTNDSINNSFISEENSIENNSAIEYMDFLSGDLNF